MECLADMKHFAWEKADLVLVRRSSTTTLLRSLGHVEANRLRLEGQKEAAAALQQTRPQPCSTSLAVGGRNPAPPKKPRNDDFPVNTNKPGLSTVSKWTMLSVVKLTRTMR